MVIMILNIALDFHPLYGPLTECMLQRIEHLSHSLGYFRRRYDSTKAQLSKTSIQNPLIRTAF